jgi:hypothetical protein
MIRLDSADTAAATRARTPPPRSSAMFGLGKPRSLERKLLPLVMMDGRVAILRIWLLLTSRRWRAPRGAPLRFAYGAASQDGSRPQSVDDHRAGPQNGHPAGSA